MPQPLVTTFSAVPSGTSVIAKFEITTAQVDEIYTASAGGSHPCALTHVTADNERDVISPAIDLVTRFNNLAQRNLSVVSVQPAQMTRYYFLLKGGATGNRERFIIETLDQNSRPARFGQGTISLLLKAVTPEEARSRFPRPLAFGLEHLNFVEVVGGNFDRQARRIQILEPRCEVVYESIVSPPGGPFHLLELVTVISEKGPEELTIRISRGGAGGVTVKYRVFRHG